MRRWLVVSLVAVALVTGAAAIWSVRSARQFRRGPTLSRAQSLFDSEIPPKVAARWLLLKHGSPMYEAALRGWMFSASIKIQDNPWNRWLLERDVAAMSGREQAEYLPTYPLRPGPALLPYLKQLLLSEPCSALPLIGRIEAAEAQGIYRNFIAEHLAGPKNKDLFKDNVRCFLSSAVPPSRVFTAFWPKLTEDEKDEVLESAAAALTDEAQVAGDLLSWLAGHLRRRDILLNSASATLLGRLLAFESTRESAEAVTLQHLDDLDPNEIEHLTNAASPGDRQEIAQTLFSAIGSRKPAVAAELVHVIAHLSIEKAERLAGPVLDGPDSELKKDLIVILVRHQSALGRQHLDEAFSGQARRSTMFAHANQYIYGSKAAAEYREISAHDYNEVGKRWPPAVKSDAQIDAEILRWPDFIQRYPQFPGTDDAYYRLAYSYFARGNLSSALTTLKEYFSAAHPDEDAKPFLVHLTRQIALALAEPAAAEQAATLHDLLAAVLQLAPEAASPAADQVPVATTDDQGGGTPP